MLDSVLRPLFRTVFVVSGISVLTVAIGDFTPAQAQRCNNCVRGPINWGRVQMVPQIRATAPRTFAPTAVSTPMTIQRSPYSGSYQTARSAWNSPTVQRGVQAWNTPAVRDVRGVWSTGRCATGSLLGCAGAGSYIVYNTREALRQPNPVTTPAYIMNGRAYYVGGPGTTPTTSPPLFPR